MTDWNTLTKLEKAKRIVDALSNPLNHTYYPPTGFRNQPALIEDIKIVKEVLCELEQIARDHALASVIPEIASPVDCKGFTGFIADSHPQVGTNPVNQDK